jgi:hypothetical protein
MCGGGFQPPEWLIAFDSAAARSRRYDAAPL